MKESEKTFREKKLKLFNNCHKRSCYLNGGYFYNDYKGFIERFSGCRTKKTFKKLNSHHKRQKIRSLISQEKYEELTDKLNIDIWGWD